SQSAHSWTIQKRWLASPSPVMAPSRTVHDSGFWLAFQPLRVLPSNMLIQPSLPAAERAAGKNKTVARMRVFIAAPGLPLYRSCAVALQLRGVAGLGRFPRKALPDGRGSVCSRLDSA